MLTGLVEDKYINVPITWSGNSLWHLSFVNMSHVSLSVRTALNFGKQTVPLQFYKSNFDTYTIICDVKSALHSLFLFPTWTVLRASEVASLVLLTQLSLLSLWQFLWRSFTLLRSDCSCGIIGRVSHKRSSLIKGFDECQKNEIYCLNMHERFHSAFWFFKLSMSFLNSININKVLKETKQKC